MYTVRAGASSGINRGRAEVKTRPVAPSGGSSRDPQPTAHVPILQQINEWVLFLFFFIFSWSERSTACFKAFSTYICYIAVHKLKKEWKNQSVCDHSIISREKSGVMRANWSSSRWLPFPPMSDCRRKRTLRLFSCEIEVVQPNIMSNRNWSIEINEVNIL